MRIISGEYGGRRLKPVPGSKTRPTTDKVREALFNVIGPYFHGGNFLDLYAGSGAVAIEAVSRGVSHAWLVDKQFAAFKTIKENINNVADSKQFSVFKMDAGAALTKFKKNQHQFNLIFLDPPYAKQKMVEDLSVIKENDLLEDDGMVICETDNQTVLPDKISGYNRLKRKDYGLTQITIYQRTK